MRRVLLPSFVLLAALSASCFVGRTRSPRTVQAATVPTTDPCFLPQALFGDTEEPMFQDRPPDHSINPADCFFYQPAWQEFLYATKPLPSSHLPKFLSFDSFQDIFQTRRPSTAKNDNEADLVLQLEPRDVQRANAPSQAHQRLLDQAFAENSSAPGDESLDDTVQAAVGRGVGGALIDQQGHFIYYAIHANPEMVQFLKDNKLTGPDVVAHLPGAPPFVSLTSFSSKMPSLVEYKSAWMIVDGPKAAPHYYVAKARVPRYLVNAEGKIAPVVQGTNHQVETREVWVSLLAIHVVFTLPGHPEMIWSTFEHVGVYNGTWQRDNAPAAKSNPDGTPVTLVINRPDYPLYKANTPPSQCNTSISDVKEMASHWDPDSQSFTKGGLLQTSVYRMYPGSKFGGDPPSSGEDDEVQAINNNATKMFANGNLKKLDGDKRQYYRLVGAIWMDKPAHLKVGMAIANPSKKMSTDDLAADVAGEDGLGSTAMESFTETEGVAVNCFSCHDTQSVPIASIAKHRPLPASNVNLSHLMSKYVGTFPPTP